MGGDAENKRLIVVDDNPGVRGTYRDMLEIRHRRKATSFRVPETSDPADTMPSFEVTYVSSGEEAVEHVRKDLAQGKRFCGGFFDVLMPGGIDGIETIKRVRALDPQLLCTIVTAYQDRPLEEISAIFPQGQKDEWNYINKPFNQMEITQRALNMVYSWNLKRERDRQHRELEEKQALIESQVKELERMNAHLEEMVRDRTERLFETVEELKRSNEKLLDLDRLKLQFINVVSHELRTPLSVLEGDIPMQISEQFGALTEPQRRSLDRMMAATDRMSSVVNNMIELSEDAPIELVSVNLEAVIRSTVERLEARIGKKGVDLRIDVAADLRVLSDATKLSGALLCVLDNAVRYGGEHNSVSIEARIPEGEPEHIRISELWAQGTSKLVSPPAGISVHDGRWISLMVRDHGRGIERSDLEKIFDTFYITDCTNVREDRRIGLGLPVARHLMFRLRGAIECLSEGPGKGATFVFYIPLSSGGVKHETK